MLLSCRAGHGILYLRNGLPVSVTFFIGPFDPALWKYGDPDPAPTTDLRIDPEDYSKELLKRWPHAKYHPSTPESPHTYLLDEPGRSGLRVTLHNSPRYPHVALELGANFIEFILWHRQMVPAKYVLFLFNSSSWDSLKLLPDTTREEIQEFTGIRDI